MLFLFIRAETSSDSESEVVAGKRRVDSSDTESGDDDATSANQNLVGVVRALRNREAEVDDLRPSYGITWHHHMRAHTDGGA